MTELTTFQEIKDFITRNRFALLYLSSPDCGVCRVLKPKVEHMLAEYPEVESAYIDLNKVPEAGGQFQVFTIPGILVFIDSKESIREARHISMALLEEKIARYYEIYKSIGK
ncbi:MAG: thioredoxin family protein [Spirochaetia bacterium]